MRQDSINEFTTKLEESGMREVLVEKYLQPGETAPATFLGGQWKIDGAWATEDLQILQGGHSDITDTAGGDHPWIWADITEESFTWWSNGSLHKTCIPKTVVQNNSSPRKNPIITRV